MTLTSELLILKPVRNIVRMGWATFLPIADDASTRLINVTEAAAPFDLKVSWAKTKLQNLGSGTGPNGIYIYSNNICLGLCILDLWGNICQTMSDAPRDIATLTFDLGGHGACRRYRSSFSICVPS